MANMSSCTYPELYQAMKILWGKTPIWYSESIDEPATITMTVPALSSFDETANFLGVWEIRPAGVQLNFVSAASEAISINAGFKRSAFVIAHIKTGAKPQRAVILAFDGIILDEMLSKRTFTPDHGKTRESLHSGTSPSTIMLLDSEAAGIIETLSKEAYGIEHERSGTEPQRAVTGGSDSAGIAAGISTASFSIKYKKCGRGTTKP
jgi:hypothetical protein